PALPPVVRVRRVPIRPGLFKKPPVPRAALNVFFSIFVMRGAGTCGLDRAQVHGEDRRDPAWCVANDRNTARR
ncbi:MAG TPA: hypothetical protein VKG92_03610, partial [Flavobacteriales bacterium]|nr:hypothetical protein [Flavobacteriales bacterium]